MKWRTLGVLAGLAAVGTAAGTVARAPGAHRRRGDRGRARQRRDEHQR